MAKRYRKDYSAQDELDDKEIEEFERAQRGEGPAKDGKPLSIKLAKQRKIVIIHQWSMSQPLKKNTADKINSL